MSRKSDPTFRTAAVLRDLQWLADAPCLLRTPPRCLGLIQKSARHLANGNVPLTDDGLSELAARRSGPLGRYFEALVRMVLESSADIDPLYSNVPVRAGASTRGEFDFLFRWRGNWTHLEVAVKFYIGVKDRLNPDNWHGPALRDSLGRKWRHMTGRQLTLSQEPSARDVLRDLGIDAVHGEALIMGRLFHPLRSETERVIAMPAWVSPDHARGWWLRAGELPEKRPAALDGSWQQLSKPDWLSAVPAGSQRQNTISAPELKRLKRPTQFAIVGSGEDGQAAETSRGFVVPDDWGAKLK